MEYVFALLWLVMFALFTNRLSDWWTAKPRINIIAEYNGADELLILIRIAKEEIEESRLTDEQHRMIHELRDRAMLDAESVLTVYDPSI